MKQIKQFFALIIKHAVLANMAFSKGEELYRETEKVEARHTVLKDFNDTHSITATTTAYYTALAAESVFSAFLLMILVETTGNEFFWLKFTLVVAVYVTFMYHITKMSAQFIFDGSTEIIELQSQLKYLQGNTEEGVIHRIARNKAANTWKGYLLSVLFLSTLGLLGLFRNYLINKSNWFVFDSPDDVLFILFPLLIGIVLIYLGRFKQISYQFRQSKKYRKKMGKVLTDLKEDVLEFSQKCLELYHEGENKKLTLPSNNADVRLCLERMNAKSIADPYFFASSMVCIVTVKLLNDTTPLKNTSIVAVTAASKTIRATTDDKGVVIFQWQALQSNSYLTSISVNDAPISNAFLENGGSYTLQLPTEETAEDAADTTNNAHKNGQYSNSDFTTANA